MVNLAFCKLDVTYLTFWQFRSTTFIYFHLESLQRDGHSCWNFSVDLLSIILIGAFQIASAFLVICCSDFVFQERSLLADLREISGNDDEHGSWFRFAGCCWYHDGFFQTTAGVCSDQGQWINLNFLRFFDRFGRFCLLLCLCIILTWNPIDYRLKPLLLVVHQRIYWCCISSLCL